MAVWPSALKPFWRMLLGYVFNIYFGGMCTSMNSCLKVTIIKEHNYPEESHFVRTRDDYILQAFRIPNSPLCRSPKKKPPVLLLHGLTASADTFLLNGPKDGLPFMLTDACYDVWLANFRGTRYSRYHISLDPKDKAFWNFSFHELGVEDLAAFIDYILQKTNQKAVHIVAHSQGCTTVLVLLSTRPEYNKKIKTAILMAPAAFMKHTSTMGQSILKPFIMQMDDSEFLYHNQMMSSLTSTVCGLGSWGKSICSLYMFVNGKASNHMNMVSYL